MSWKSGGAGTSSTTCVVAAGGGEVRLQAASANRSAGSTPATKCNSRPGPVRRRLTLITGNPLPTTLTRATGRPSCNRSLTLTTVTTGGAANPSHYIGAPGRAQGFGPEPDDFQNV